MRSDGTIPTFNPPTLVSEDDVREDSMAQERHVNNSPPYIGCRTVNNNNEGNKIRRG